MKIFFKKKPIVFISNFLNFIASSELGRQFLVIVVLPIFLIGAYLVFFMPDRYVSEAHVLIKESGVGQLDNGFFEGLGFDSGGSMEDNKILQSYLVSPNILEILERELGLRNHYGRSNDFIFGLSMSESFEEFLDFYRRHVQVKYNTNTGLLAIRVESYSPEFSKSLVDNLLVKSDKFINESGQLIAKLEMQFTLDEISLTQERLKKAKQALIDFQNDYGLVSPDSDGESLFAIIFSLEDELAKTEAKIHQAESYLNQKSPQLSVLANKSEALRKEISIQKQRVTGEVNGDDKLNELSAEYQSLVLDVELATTLYTSTLSAFEMARVQAAKQLKYLIIASKPHLADDPLYPKRLYWFATWLVILFIVLGIYRVIIASINEHKD